MISNERLSFFIDQLRREKHYSLRTLGEKVGLSRTSLSDYFNNKKEIPLNKLNEFSEALNVSVEHLLTYACDSEPMNPDDVKQYYKLSATTFIKIYASEQDLIEVEELIFERIKTNLQEKNGDIMSKNSKQEKITYLPQEETILFGDNNEQVYIIDGSEI